MEGMGLNTEKLGNFCMAILSICILVSITTLCDLFLLWKCQQRPILHAHASIYLHLKLDLFDAILFTNNIGSVLILEIGNGTGAGDAEAGRQLRQGRGVLFERQTDCRHRAVERVQPHASRQKGQYSWFQWTAWRSKAGGGLVCCSIIVGSIPAGCSFGHNTLPALVGEGGGLVVNSKFITAQNGIV